MQGQSQKHIFKMSPWYQCLSGLRDVALLPSDSEDSLQGISYAIRVKDSWEFAGSLQLQRHLFSNGGACNW